MEPLYDPAAVERRWQEMWEGEGLYAAGAGRRRNESFVIALPPPVAVVAPSGTPWLRMLSTPK